MRNTALKRLIPYVRPYWRRLLLALALAILGIAAETVIPLVIKEVIDGPLTNDEQRSMLLPLAAVLVVLGLVETGMSYLRRNTAARVSHQMETELRDDLYAHLQRLHVGFHDNWQSGQLLSRAVYDISTVRRFVGWGAMFLLLSILHFVAIVGLLLTLNAPLAIACALGLTPIGYISYRWSKRYRVISRQVQDEQGDLTTIIEEAATGIRIIKSFGRGVQMLGKFRRQAKQLMGTNLSRAKLVAVLWPAFDIVFNLTLVMVLVLTGLAHLRGELTIGGVVAFISYLLMLVWPLDALGWILAMGEEARTATERVFEIFDTTPDIQDRADAGVIDETTGHLRLENVWFRYPKSKDWVLRDVDLELRPGETLALVGKTGSGKTTIASLFSRLYDPDEGRVTMDGRDFRDVTLKSLRRHIGVAFEDPILFSASVRENLIMGRPSASDDELREALVTAQADFVYELPWGLETRVGEQGYTLSGGQRQRLALARAVLGKPKVLVLDDPLSSVDVHTEALIEEALARVLSGVTGLLIVHRPSTLALADRVALLEGGTIVATGTHTELMETNELYRAILAQEAEELTA